MRIPARVVLLMLTVFILSCDQRNAVPDVDPMLGVECFESHRATLPPGTQYEGIEELSENSLTIRIMNGIDVVNIECARHEDGSLQKVIE